MIHTAADKRAGLPPHRCPFIARRDGYCDRHHPREQAKTRERQAMAHARKIEQLGFTVTFTDKETT